MIIFYIFFIFCLHSISFCQWSPLWWDTYWKNAVIYFLCRPFSFLLYKSFQTPSGDKNIRNRILSSYLLTFKEQKNGIITCLRVLWYILNVSFFVKHMCWMIASTQLHIMCGNRIWTSLTYNCELGCFFSTSKCSRGNLLN